MTSYHPKDIESGYCGNCHTFTGTGTGEHTPTNPCVVCWRTKHRRVRAVWVAENGMRRIILCDEHARLFREMDQDHPGELKTQYRAIKPGERVRVGGIPL
jgi:hypothetical protein